MRRSAHVSQGVPEAVAAYKVLLRGFVDARPPGTRARIASALGKHKSWVSQLTERHLPVILDA